jgi:phage-related protein
MVVSNVDKELMILSGEIKTPPMSKEARIETGYLLRLLQLGESLSLPQSRPMPAIGKRCHELRINDAHVSWRIIYRVDADAILILEILLKRQEKHLKKL